MSTKRETPAQKAARISAQREAQAQFEEAAGLETVDAPSTPRPAVEQVPTKPVRITLDLAPNLYDSFGDWNRRAARQIGVGRITGAETLRVLLRRLLADDQLAASVLDDLRRQQ